MLVFEENMKKKEPRFRCSVGKSIFMALLGCKFRVGKLESKLRLIQII